MINAINVAIGAGAVTLPYGIGQGSLVSLTATEANVQHILGQDTTFKDLGARLSVNDHTGAGTLAFRVDGKNGNQVVTIPASATGFFSCATGGSAGKTSPSDFVRSGSFVSATIISGTGGSALTVAFVSCYMKVATGNSVIFQNLFSTNTNTVARFYPLVSPLTGGNTEANEQQIFEMTGVLRNLQTYVTANTRTGSTTFVVRDNGANGSVTLSVPAATTGRFQDLVNTDTITIGQTVGLSVSAGLAAESLTYQNIQIQGDFNDGGKSEMLLGRSEIVSPSDTGYYTLSGNITNFTSELSRQLVSAVRGSLSLLEARLSGNSILASSTYGVRINGVDGAVALSFPASTTGVFTDLADTDLVNLFDRLALQIVTGAGGTNLTIRNTSVAFGIRPDDDDLLKAAQAAMTQM